MDNVGVTMSDYSIVSSPISKLSGLTKGDKLAVLAELIGFKVMPVDIDTFIKDDYYLGKVTNNGSQLYDVWKGALHELYPDPINTNTFVCLNGAIRTGKSNTSKIMIIYDLYKHLCLGENIYKFYSLMERPFLIGVVHQTKEKAWANVNEIWDWISQSPYFQDQMNDPDSLIHKFQIQAVRNSDDFIGKNMCELWGTELNFIPPDFGIPLIDSAISRIEGTFSQGFNLFVHIILDSSDTTNSAVVPQFLAKSPHGKSAIQYKFSIYEAKPDLYYNQEDPNHIDTNEYQYNTRGEKSPNPYYGKPRRTFRLYRGDSEYNPFVLAPYAPEVDPKIMAKLDPDRFIDVPLELLDLATANIELFLNEKCGVAVETTNQYYNSTLVRPRFNLPNLVHSRDSMEPSDIIQVDFYDPGDTFVPLFKEAVLAIPEDRPLFGRIDLGLVNDRTGLAIGYVQDVCAHDVDGIISYDPIIKIPIAVGISRYTGQETSMDKLCDLIQWIHSVRPFHEFTTDTFQSYVIQQRCRESQIPSRMLSVDRTKTAFQLCKTMFYRGKLDVCDNKVLKTETFNVYDTGYKIDHHEYLNELGEIGSDSKDILDAVVGCVQSAYEAVCNDALAATTPKIVSNTKRDEFNSKLIDAWENASLMNKYIHSMRSHNVGMI